MFARRTNDLNVFYLIRLTIRLNEIIMYVTRNNDVSVFRIIDTFTFDYAFFIIKLAVLRGRKCKNRRASPKNLDTHAYGSFADFVGCIYVP